MARTLLITLALGVVPASSAAAAVCGTSAASGEVYKGFLALNENTASTDLRFERSTDPGTLSLIFRVTGCDLAPGALEPTMTVLPPPRGGEKKVNDDAVEFKSAQADPHSIEVLLDVDPDYVDPGSYGALIALRAPYIATTRTPISVSRSEPNALIPLGWGALWGVLGMAFFSLLRRIKRIPMTVSRRWLFFAGVVAACVGAAVVYGNYLDQEVWAFEQNGLAAAGTGFSAGTSGVMTTLLGAMWGSDTGAPADRAQPVS